MICSYSESYNENRWIQHALLLRKQAAGWQHRKDISMLVGIDSQDLPDREKVPKTLRQCAPVIRSEEWTTIPLRNTTLREICKTLAANSIGKASMASYDHCDMSQSGLKA